MAYRERARDLGPSERRYASPPPVRPILIALVVFGLPGAALLTGFQSEPGQVFAGDRFTNGAIGIVLVAIAVVFVRFALRKATLSVDVHANGLRWREAGLTRDIHWDEIVEIRGAHTKRTVVGAEVARTSVYRLRLESGAERVATSMLGDVRALAERIEQELLARLLPKTIERLDRGETVLFGPLALDARGVTLDEGKTATVEWPQVEAVTVSDGTIAVRGPQPIEIEWSKVPNACVLLAAVEARLAVTSTARRPAAR